MDPDLAFALELADLADAVTLSRFLSEDLKIERKPDTTHVTDADHAAELVIRSAILKRFPDDSILGEEFGAEGESGRRWIIDPIDGTANFMRGIPIWATLIGLERDGVVDLSLIHI
jgi:histidinol-phosphatase